MLGILAFGNWISGRRAESSIDTQTNCSTCLLEWVVMWIKGVTALSLHDSNIWEEGCSSGPEHGLVCPNTPVTAASQRGRR